MNDVSIDDCLLKKYLRSLQMNGDYFSYKGSNANLPVTLKHQYEQELSVPFPKLSFYSVVYTFCTLLHKIMHLSHICKCVFSAFELIFTIRALFFDNISH